MIYFLIGLFLLILVGGVMSAAIVAQDRAYLKEMEETVAHYEHNRSHGFADPAAAWKETRKELARIKRRIYSGDKASVEAARDIIDAFDRSPDASRE